MFAAIGAKTLFIFGACNAITIPMVWALYPESNQRTLEEMDLLFASDSWWNWDAEKNFARLKEENPELVHAARKGNTVVDPETGALKHDIATEDLFEGSNGGQRSISTERQP